MYVPTEVEVGAAMYYVECEEAYLSASQQYQRNSEYITVSPTPRQHRESERLWAQVDKAEALLDSAQTDLYAICGYDPLRVASTFREAYTRHAAYC